MWRSKKFIIISVLAVVLLAGGIGGIALAADNGNDSQSKPTRGDLLGKVCEIYQQKTGVAIDQEVLKDSFAQAQSEIQKERQKALLQDLVDQGKITQEQADALLNWWDARPDVPAGFGFPGGPHGPGGFRGMGGPPCAPPE